MVKNKVMEYLQKTWVVEMTDEDEEKAEEYSKGKAREHYNFLFEENSGSPADFARLCYLDGLAEGRKEEDEKLFDNWCKGETPEPHECPFLQNLEKENAKLKEKLSDVTKDKDLLMARNLDLVSKNEYLQEQNEKIKCCQMCKYLEHNGSCLRADKDEVNKWGDFLIGTRRKNHCKYWELAE